MEEVDLFEGFGDAPIHLPHARFLANFGALHSTIPLNDDFGTGLERASVLQANGALPDGNIGLPDVR